MGDGMDVTIEAAPVALFVYNRIEHTRRTVEALKNNYGAPSTALYVFSDGPKDMSDEERVADVREYIGSISGFRDINIIRQELNVGLAKSIIEGVSMICARHGRIIVLEDDLVTSPHFLNYMNESLRYYENTQEVMHISGCRYPCAPFCNSDTFFLQVPLCWGWATWDRAWTLFQKDLTVMARFNLSQINRFSFKHHHTFWEQLKLNASGEISTWFIFWYATVFLQGGLALFPSRSLVTNIGMDASGTNCGTTSVYNSDLSESKIVVGNIPIIESAEGYESHLAFFKSIKGGFVERLKRKVKKLFA